MYNNFLTDRELEQNGVPIDYGEFRVWIARAGGSNLTFSKTAAEIMRPYKRALETGTMTDEVARPLMAEVYAKTVIRRWEIREGDGWVAKVAMPDGTTVPFSPEAVKALLATPELNDLFMEIQRVANSNEAYRKAAVEAEAKNL